MDDEQQVKEKNFVEEVGLFFEQTGLPRMAGRILGWLLISEPPHQSMDELAVALAASKGSISSMTRLLIQFGLIERFNVPGVRHGYFRLRPDTSHYLIELGFEQLTTLRQLAERGLDLLQGKAPLTRQWLEEMRALYSFFERESVLLLKRWEQERANVGTSASRMSGGDS